MQLRKTALYHAAEVGSTEITKLLLGGVDVEARDWVSCTTLCIAGACIHPDTNTMMGAVYCSPVTLYILCPLDGGADVEARDWESWRSRC